MDKTRDRGATPLYIASQKRHLLLVEALIAEKADINLVQKTTAGAVHS